MTRKCHNHIPQINPQDHEDRQRHEGENTIEAKQLFLEFPAR